METDSVGIFDSGVGGLSVWREIARQFPAENLLYLADQGHVPYGPRPMAQIRQYSTAITRFLLSQGAKLIVVACNTASAAALYHLRATFPDVPFVGMEPAVKPAAETSHSGVIGVIATVATFQGELFGSLVERFASDVQVLTQTCPGLVEAVEAGELDSPATEALLRKHLAPLTAARVDTLVLGCTHYPFLTPLIARVVGPGVHIVDPAPAVARQVGRVLAQRGMRGAGHTVPVSLWEGMRVFYTSGELAPFADLITRLFDEPSNVRQVTWQDGCLRA
jgi:glutamate racemase